LQIRFEAKTRIMKRRLGADADKYKSKNKNHHLVLSNLVLAITVLLSSASTATSAARPPKLPDVSSTLLKLHKIYTSHPPHDNSLYDTLWVSPNATLVEIQKSYRKLSRQFHPDKQRRRRNNNLHETSDQSEEALEQIQTAYEVLKDDATRLPYHKYGLRDLETAVLLLTGYQNTPKLPSSGERELLSLMGYHVIHQSSRTTSRLIPQSPPPLHQAHTRPLSSPQQDNVVSSSSSPQERQEQRIQFLAASILERIRPLVEGTVTETMLAHSVWSECDRLKRLPLGAQIIRCVGRAYRHAGKRLLRRYNIPIHSHANIHRHHHHHHHRYNHHHHHHSHNSHKLALAVSEPIRDRWRDTKHLWTAAIASGRVALQENWKLKSIANNQKQSRKDKTSIAYHNQDIDQTPEMAWLDDSNSNSHMIDDDDDFTNMMVDDSSSDGNSGGDEYSQQNEEIQLTEAQKAQKVMMELLQVEAFWKVHKIDIDRSVRQACNLILCGRYFFFPSHHQQQDEAAAPTWQQQCNPSSQQQQATDGWVSTGHSSHHVINAQEGRIRAAKAMVLVGNVMVQCSKDGTSWME